MLLGLDEVLSALNDAALKARAGAIQVIDDTVTTCTQLAANYCPVETGELQSAITSSPAEDGGDTITGACGIPDGVVDYAWYVEHGHFTRNHSSYVPPNPFIERGFLEVQPDFFSEMESIDF